MWETMGFILFETEFTSVQTRMKGEPWHERCSVLCSSRPSMFPVDTTSASDAASVNDERAGRPRPTLANVLRCEARV